MTSFGPSGITVESFKDTKLNDQLDALVEQLKRIADRLELGVIYTRDAGAI